MAFVNELISNENIDKYKIPLHKDNDEYWTFDKERNIYLWGGRGGNPAYGFEIVGKFDLSVDGKLFKITIEPGDGSKNFTASPYYVVWNSIIAIEPRDLNGMNVTQVILILKEALDIYGRDGRLNNYTPVRVVKFNF
jgi:hypothetical protein